MVVKYVFLLTCFVIKTSCEKKSLTFVIDATRSMTDDISQVRQASKSIMDIVLNEQSSQIEDIVLVIFRDPGLEFRKRTKNETELKQALDDINLIGNWDCPEMCLSGIKEGLEQSLPGSFIYVFTDASAKDHEKFEEIKILSQEKQSQVVFVLTGDCGDLYSPASRVYNKIAVASNGEVFRVSKENVGEVLESVKETIKGDKTVITSTVVHATPGSDSYVNFNIDDKTEYALVSTSGSDVALKVSKAGIDLPGTKVTWTKNVKVLKLLGITPGTYRAAVRGNSDVNVLVFGRTDFNFRFGFSNDEQNSLKYTETQPITGSETYLIISVKDDEHSVNIENVTILDMSESVIRRLNLTNVGSNVYRTDKFLPPNVMFKVEVSGTARRTGNLIRRIASTPVEPIKPVKVAPEITDTENYIKAKEYSEVNIRCRIRKGKPKPHVTWYFKEKGATEYKLLPDKTDDVLFKSNVLSGDIGEYKCVAENVAGQAKHNVQLEVLVKPKFEHAPTKIEEKENVPVTLTCRFRKGNPRPRITWSFQASGSSTFTTLSNSGEELKLPAVQLKDSGEYRCVAENSEGRAERTMLLTVLVSTPEQAPIVTIVGGDEMNAEYDEPLQLKCKVSGYPQPDIIWVSDDTGKRTQTDSTIELPSDFISVLDINKVNKNATYTCKAVNRLGTGVKSIVVKTKIKNYFNILELPKDTTIEYGKRGEIHCKVDAFPTASVTWLKNFKPLIADGNVELSADNSTLSIHSMAPYIADKYLCEARNPLNRKYFTFQVAISGVEPPVINKTTYYVTAKKHSDVDIHCDVIKGKPKPTITWLYNDQYSPSSFTDLQISSDTIHLDYLLGDDMAIYRCVVENIVGIDHHDIELVVEYPPEVMNTTSPRVVKNEGEMVTLPCPVDGSPTPDVIWKLNGKQLLSDLTHRIYSDNSIRFKATLTGSGNYECEASNDHGAIRINTRVDVIIPVEIQPPKQGALEVIVGNTAVLPCLADGFPKPVLSWVYHSKDPKTPPKSYSPSDVTGSLELRRIQQEKNGYYTCVATNTGGSKNITYEVIVLASPFIQFTKKQFRAVLDDVMLRVPCQATGNPKPTITWMKGGYDVPTGTEWYDIAQDGSLIIKNIDMGSAGSYLCQARNKFGSDTEAFEVAVDSSVTPDLITNTLTIEEGKPATVPCNVPYQRTDRVRWFKDGRLVARDELKLLHVTARDAGVYSCRVSSFTGARTGVTKVITGSKPEFVYYSEKGNIIEYNEGDTQIMDCTTRGTTKPEIKWLHDGASVDHDQLTYIVQMDSPSVKGRYTCIVSNDFGSAQQEFEVQSFGCALDIKNDFNGNAPLMLTPKFELPNFEVADGHVNIPKDEFIVLYCPAGFTTVYKRDIMVTCVNNKEFDYEGTKYLYSDLKCRTKVEARPLKTGLRCNHGNSELVDVGFNAGKKFAVVYKVCIDGIKTVYSKLNLQPTLANVLPSYGFDNGPDDDLNTIFNCNYQNKQITDMLGLEFHRDGCCFEKRQLVSSMDVAPGLSQTATYTSLNVVPHWSTCNSQNWDDVERRIRMLAVKANHELQVWTGVAQDLQLPDANSTMRNITFRIGKTEHQVPTYLWKVVQDPASRASLAIIQVNVPDLNLRESWKYRLCRDVCTDVTWMRSSTWRNIRRGFTYCCSLQDFERAFRYYGEFPPYTKLLKDVDVVSEHYLHL